MSAANFPRFLLGLLVDYGSDVTTQGGLRAYQRSTRAARDREIRSPAAYVGVCRAIAPVLAPRHHACRQWDGWTRRPVLDWSKGAVDGRLIAAGWNRVPPRRWVDGELERFLGYWKRCAPRPDVVGSSYNPDPDLAARAWRAEIPARLVAAARPIRIEDREGRIRRMPRERVRRLLNANRAANRTSVGHRNVSVKALARLGQLCPELQRAALASLPDEGTEKPLRVRDLDWPAVARLQKGLAADATGRIRAAWAEGRRQEALIDARPRDAEGYRVSVEAWMCPSYPLVRLDYAIRLARGASPAALAASVDVDARFTKAEAHAWCEKGAPENMLEWWLHFSPWRIPERGTVVLRSWAVARWLKAVEDRGDYGALLRERTIRGPAGAVAIVRYIDRADEIQDVDLVRGPRTGVDVAFEHAAERSGEAWLEKARADHRVLGDLPVGWRLYPRCMRHLATPAQLAREGDELEHCVGGYAPAVESGRSIILAIQVGEQRSTVELDRVGRVLQHYGARNSDPPVLCARVLDRFLQKRAHCTIHRSGLDDSDHRR